MGAMKRRRYLLPVVGITATALASVRHIAASSRAWFGTSSSLGQNLVSPRIVSTRRLAQASLTQDVGPDIQNAEEGPVDFAGFNAGQSIGRDTSSTGREDDVAAFLHVPRDVWLDGVVASVVRRGAWVLVTPPAGGNQVKGMVPKSHFSHGYATKVSPGDNVQVRVLKVNITDQSLKLTMVQTLKKLSEVKIGDILQGKVTKTVNSKGIFVDCGVERDGFVSAAELMDGFPKDGILHKVGDNVTTRVLQKSNGKLWLTMRSGSLDRSMKHVYDLREQAGGALERLKGISDQEWLDGTINDMTTYGIFVAVVPPEGTEPVVGFLHKSRIGKDFDANDAYIGKEIDVRVLGVDVAKGTIALTRKGGRRRIQDIQVGEKVKGVVTGIVKEKGVYIDFYADRDGYISAGELEDGFPLDGINLSVGEKVKARVLRNEGDGERVQLTLRKGSLKRGPTSTFDIHEQTADDIVPFTNAGPDEWMEGTINSMTTRGVVVELKVPGEDRTIFGFLHKIGFTDDFAAKAIPGGNVTVRIVWKDTDRGTIGLGMRAAAKNLDELKIGDLVSGTVTQVLGQAGIFVDCGVGKDGYIPIGELQEGFPLKGITHETGDFVTARVHEITDDKLWLTCRRDKLERGPRYDVPAQADANVSGFVGIPSDMWLDGTINDMSAAGIFVALTAPGEMQKISGFLHKSQIKTGYTSRAILGGKVRVRVQSVDESTGSVRLSMREITEVDASEHTSSTDQIEGQSDS